MKYCTACRIGAVVRSAGDGQGPRAL